MRKFFNLLKEGGGSIVFGAVCACIGSALFIPSTGFVTTLPLIVLFAALPALIIKRSTVLPPMFFAAAYFFCFAKDTPQKLTELPGGYTLFVALLAFVISVSTCVSCHFAKEAYTKKKRVAIYAIASVVFAVLAVLGNAWLNGTPTGFLKAKGEISIHIETNFVSEELDVGGIYYVNSRKYYVTDAKISNGNNIGTFVYSNGNVTNDLSKYIVTYTGEEKARKISEVLKKAFPSDSFTVTPNDRSFDGIKVSLGSADELLPLISYTVTINSEETAKTFVKKAEAFVAVLNGSGIDCQSIRMVGGEKQKLYYSIEVDTTAPNVNLSSFLRVYSNIPLPQDSILAAHKSFAN